MPRHPTRCASPNEIEACAQAAHEANRAYCAAIGDDSQVPWESAPDWQKNSARDGVKGVLNGNTPEQSHEAWMSAKRRDGWSYGPTKDAASKTHPCMVPYHRLSPAQREKDTIFCNTVTTIARAMKLTIRNGRDFEEALEEQFWEFDARRKMQVDAPSERDTFKNHVRFLVNEVRAGRIQQPEWIAQSMEDPLAPTEPHDSGAPG